MFRRRFKGQFKAGAGYFFEQNVISISVPPSGDIYYVKENGDGGVMSNIVSILFGIEAWNALYSSEYDSNTNTWKIFFQEGVNIEKDGYMLKIIEITPDWEKDEEI